MTHRTVPLNLLVRVRDALFQHQCSQGCKVCEDIAELTAQIEQQGQGEPVAWQYFDAGQWWPTSSIDKYPPNIPTRALYATPPQDSVPAWAWRQAIAERLEESGIPIGQTPAWLESRALALAQTKG